MKCIIVDDEPIARIGMKRLVSAEPDLEALAYLDSAEAAASFLEANPVDLRASGGIITVRADRRFVRVRISDITRIEALKDYVIIHSSDSGRIITRMKIKDGEDLLPSGEFLRVNRSNIVRGSAVTSFDTNDIYLGEPPLAIGPTYRRQLLDSLL